MPRLLLSARCESQEEPGTVNGSSWGNAENAHQNVLVFQNLLQLFGLPAAENAPGPRWRLL